MPWQDIPGQGWVQTDQDNPEPQQPVAPPQVQGQVGGQDVFSGAPNQLNDQGFGAVSIGGGSPLQPRPQSLNRLLGLGGGQQPQQPYVDRPNPLTGVMERIPLPGGGSAAGGYGAMPASPNPWILNQVSQAERALDVLNEQHGQQKISDQQFSFGQQKLQKYMDRVDPSQQYRRDGLLRTQTPMEKFMAQQTHVLRDPAGNERGLVMLDGKGIPHFHEFKRDDTDWHKQQLEQRDQFHQHSMDVLREKLEWEKNKLQQQLEARDKAEQSRQASKDHTLEISKAVSKTAVDIFNAHAHDQEVSLGKDAEGKDKKSTKRVYGKTMEEAHAMARKLHGLPDLAAPVAPDAQANPKNDLLQGLQQGFGQ